MKAMTQKHAQRKAATRDLRKKHPYERWEKTATWKHVARAVSDLLRNGDIELTTAREYVVGYICKTVLERK